MATDSLDRFERLFRAARMHPPEERAEFLNAACPDDPALREEVAALLEADDEAEADAFLDKPATGLLGNVPTPEPLANQVVGPYRVLRPLGHGGMGAVYLAVRETPFQQYVALKLIHAGLHSPNVLQRFEQERQILASLHHPGIARLLDGGVTEDGLPYFAMEYVEGRPLTAYCDEHRLSIEDRLALFRRVCEAVHYAHQNLVLHRDLKPSNILVTTNREVKLLDFGIAKLLNPGLSPSAMPITRTALQVMTPEYASPEQVRGEGLTTASDVYSLGVVLYELLAGHRPYRLTRGTADEMIQVVCEQDPERPSTAAARARTVVRSDGTAETTSAASIGEARDLTPERLQRRLRGDLDTIVLKTLRKEPHRRYASAEQLGEDLDRFLSGESVLAHEGSWSYRVGKFVRRNRIQVAATAAVFVALLGGLGAALWQANEAGQARDQAEAALDQSEAVSTFLLDVFRAADPTLAQRDSLLVRDVLDTGAERTEADLADQPAVQASLFHVIAEAYQNLGQFDRAAGYMERALALRRSTLGEIHPETAASLFGLAELRVGQSQFADAEGLFREYVATSQALYGEQHPTVLRGLYEVWGTLHMQGARQGTDSLFSVLLTMEQTLPQDEDDPALAYTLAELAYALSAMDRLDESERYIRRALAMERRLHHDRHPRVALLMSRLAGNLNLTGRAAEAEPLARDAVALNRELFPEGHDQLASSLYHLGRSYQELGDYARAETALREAIGMIRDLHGPTHRYVAFYSDALADVYEAWGRPEEARRVRPQDA